MKKDPKFFSDCAAVLGPNLPGITQHDPSARKASAASARKAATTPERSTSAPAANPAQKLVDTATGKHRRKRKHRRRDAAEELRQRIEETLGITLPELPASALPSLPSAGQAAPQPPSAVDPQQLLDFLLGP
jgi:hypothetical protein